MAACSGLEHTNIDKPLSEPWKSINILDQSSSFTEIFTELQHFKENNDNHFHSFSESSLSSSPSSNSTDANAKRDENGNPSIHQDKNGSLASNYYCPNGQKRQYRHSDSFSSMNSDNLSICTEGLGFESFDDVDDLLKDGICCVGKFPPPISCIGKSGKPFVSFKSFRQDGRFILKEIRIPELLHACRENGRLKLHLIQSDDDDDDDDDDDGGGGGGE